MNNSSNINLIHLVGNASHEVHYHTGGHIGANASDSPDDHRPELLPQEKRGDQDEVSIPDEAKVCPETQGDDKRSGNMDGQHPL